MEYIAGMTKDGSVYVLKKDNLLRIDDERVSFYLIPFLTPADLCKIEKYGNVPNYILKNSYKKLLKDFKNGQKKKSKTLFYFEGNSMINTLIFSFGTFREVSDFASKYTKCR